VHKYLNSPDNQEMRTCVLNFKVPVGFPRIVLREYK